jgi:hypothetical protein
MRLAPIMLLGVVYGSPADAQACHSSTGHTHTRRDAMRIAVSTPERPATDLRLYNLLLLLLPFVLVLWFLYLYQTCGT